MVQDFDGDGLSDIGNCGPWSCLIYFAEWNGSQSSINFTEFSFDLVNDPAWGSGSERFTYYGDFDADGSVDIVRGRTSHTFNTRFFSLKGRTLASRLVTLEGEPGDLQIGANNFNGPVADMNGNGKPELPYTRLLDPAANLDFEQKRFELSATNFSKSRPNYDYHSTSEFLYTRSADFNGDGVDDAARVDSIAGLYTIGDASINLRHSTGADAWFFQTVSFHYGVDGYNPAYNPTVESLDINGDGRMELLLRPMVDTDTPQLLYKADTAGKNVQTTAFSPGNNSIIFATGDLNGDGRPDFIEARKAAGTPDDPLRLGGYVSSGRIYYSTGRHPIYSLRFSTLSGVLPASSIDRVLTGD